MHHHHQLTSAAAAAAAAYPNHHHQFYQHADIIQLEAHGQHAPAGFGADHQWAGQHQQNQHQHHFQPHQQQHQQQQQQHQQQQQQQHHHQQQQSQHQQSQHHHNQQHIYQHHQQQQTQAPNYYAVINALNGYQTFEGQQAAATYATQCDTNSVAAAVVAANTFAHYHLDQSHHHHHQDISSFQAQQQQGLAQHQSQGQHQHQFAQNDHHQAQQQHHSGPTATGSPPASSTTVPNAQLNNNQNNDKLINRDPAAPASAINQLQAFALSTPEAAAAAAAAAAAVTTFTPFYARPAPVPPNHIHRTGGAPPPTGAAKTVAKAQRQRAGAAPKSKPTKRSDGTTISQSDSGDTNKPQTTTSRSQRRYAGRASCDCPNCLDLERLRRLGLEPAAAENANGNEQQAGKKLMHVCHHAGCGKEYEKTSHLRAHLRWHTSERMSACRHSDCGKRFSRTDELRKHMKTHHSQPAAQAAVPSTTTTTTSQHQQ